MNELMLKKNIRIEELIFEVRGKQLKITICDLKFKK